MRSSVVALALALCALGSSGCATMFRSTKTTVQIESTPTGAQAEVKREKNEKSEPPTKTPSEITVSRGSLTEVHVAQPGFVEHRGVVRKNVNGWWLFSDIATCVVPVFLCIPLVADAVSGAWNDVQPRYQARLVPFPTDAPAPGYVMPPQASPSMPPPASPAAVPATVATSSMSDSERKAAARAAYQEGVDLQTQKSFAAAIERFQAAQKLFDAPPHLVHLAECYAAAGKLVEAYETYETLTHQTATKDQPAQFHEAIETGKKEIADLAPRIPTLSIQVQPAPSTMKNLTILVNGRSMPTELVGIPRPVNPGTYRVTATAWGIAAAKPVELTIAEGEKKVADLKLGK